MNTVKEIIRNSASFIPGARVKIKGYVNSAGEVKDHDVVILNSDSYQKMKEADLIPLKEFESTEPIDGCGTIPLGIARDTLIAARVKVPVEGEADKVFAAYATVGTSSLSTLVKSPDSVYLLRVARQGELEDPKPAKGEIPRAKQVLSKHLELQSRRYTHTLKFTDGKFDSVVVL